MTRPSTAAGRAIADETRELARRLIEARVRYWAAVLARPQLCAVIMLAIRQEVETGGWDRRLAVLIGLARRKVQTRRVGDARRYERACLRAAEWLAQEDQDCEIANAVVDAIALWSGRQLPPGHRWAGERLYPARTQSLTWQRYWRGVEHGRRERERLRNAIVLANEGLVVHYVQHRTQWMLRGPTSLTREDLQQHARLGLHRAADMFDPEKRDPRTGRLIQFSTYACHWLRHFVDRGHQGTSKLIRVPLTTQVLCYKLGRLLDQWPEATPADLAERLWDDRKGRSRDWAELDAKARAREVGKVADAIRCLGWTIESLEAPVGYQEGRPLTLADMVPDPGPGLDEQLARTQVTVRLLAALKGLDPESHEVVGALYGIDRTPETPQQIARRRSIKVERVEQIHHQALARMRAAVTLETASP